MNSVRVYGNRLYRLAHTWRQVVGTCCSDSLPLTGTAFCSRTMFHEIWLVLIRASWCRDKLTSVFNAPSRALLLQIVPTTTHFYASICFVCISWSTVLQHVSCAYTRRGLSSPHGHATCPQVCFWALYAKCNLSNLTLQGTKSFTRHSTYVKRREKLSRTVCMLQSLKKFNFILLQLAWGTF